jgi:hypothetical protein
MRDKREQTLAVRCTTCGAKPGEKCELSTGLPRTDPHQDRRLTASEKFPRQKRSQIGERALLLGRLSALKAVQVTALLDVTGVGGHHGIRDSKKMFGGDSRYFKAIEVLIFYLP